jgi:zinc transporter
MTNKNSTHILFSYSFDHEGKAIKTSDNKVAYELKNPELSWVHLDGANKNTKKWLEKEVDYLDHLIIEALIAEETRPRILKFEHGILLILRGITENKNIKKSEMVSIRLWIDDERIISIQRRPMKSIFELENNLNNNLNITDSGKFLSSFLNFTIQDINEYIYSTGEVIDKIEHEVLATHNMKFREKIVHTRSQLTVSRRYLAPQKEVIFNLKSCKYSWMNDFTIRFLQENLEKITHIIEETDEVLIRTKILHDELSHALNEKINRNMFKLSMIAIIFMPLTFITSLFGMNFAKIPWAENPNGFYIACFLMVIITIIQLFFFKRKDWF